MIDDLQTLAKASFDTIETTASVLFIVTAASVFAWLLTVSQAAQLMSDAILGFTSNKWVFLLLVNVLVLVIGCFLDTIAAITIIVPHPSCPSPRASGSIRCTSALSSLST